MQVTAIRRRCEQGDTNREMEGILTTMLYGETQVENYLASCNAR